MKIFDTMRSYMNALAVDSDLAMISTKMAGELCYRQPRTITTWINDGKLEGVKIDGTVYVLAASVNAYLDGLQEEAFNFKHFLIDKVYSGCTQIYYGDIAAKFGYNTTLSSDRRHIGFILGMVSHMTYDEFDGMLSAMVWNKSTGTVSDGFWDLVEQCDVDVPAAGDRHAFVEAQIKICQNYLQG